MPFFRTEESLGHPRWLKAQQRIELCGKEANPAWVLGVDKQGEKPSWVLPAHCHHKFHDNCRDLDIVGSIERLSREAEEAKESGLAMILWTWQNHWTEQCSETAMLSWVQDIRHWFQLMRRRHDITGRFVAVPEPHKSGMVHVHGVVRMLPPEMKWTVRMSHGKKYPRQVASNEWRDHARSAWYDVTGSYMLGWEKVMSTPFYVGKYATKGGIWPVRTKALICANKIRGFTRSKDLKPVPENESRWQITRGKKFELRRQAGFPVDSFEEACYRVNFPA